MSGACASVCDCYCDCDYVTSFCWMHRHIDFPVGLSSFDCVSQFAASHRHTNMHICSYADTYAERHRQPGRTRDRTDRPRRIRSLPGAIALGGNHQKKGYLVCSGQMLRPRHLHQPAVASNQSRPTPSRLCLTRAACITGRTETGWFSLPSQLFFSFFFLPSLSMPCQPVGGGVVVLMRRSG